jgi:hypothetical protein
MQLQLRHRLHGIRDDPLRGHLHCHSLHIAHFAYHYVAFYAVKAPFHPQDPGRLQTVPSLLQSCFQIHSHCGDDHHWMIPPYPGVSFLKVEVKEET